MKKHAAFIILLTAAAAFAGSFMYGCRIKTVETYWPTHTATATSTNTPFYTATPTHTITPTATATVTPGQAAQTNFYNFTSGTDGWVLNSPFISLQGYGVSVAQNTDLTYCDGGTGGSLQLNTDFSGSSDFHAVARIPLGSDQNLEYHTISARVYVPPGICSATNPVSARLYVGISTISSAVMNTDLFLTTPGWYLLTWDLGTYGMGIDHYQHINEIGLDLYKGSSSTVTYAGPFYIDTVAW